MCSRHVVVECSNCLPIKGTVSEDAGMTCAIRSMKTTMESRTVMPGEQSKSQKVRNRNTVVGTGTGLLK